MKEIAGLIVAFLLFMGMLSFITVYTETMREECRLAAIQQNYPAAEVQVMCGGK
jgi:uncharacterized membrane protein YkvI